jgi:hypothetical protein
MNKLSKEIINDQATGWTIQNRGSVTGKVKGFFFPLKHPDWLWGPTSLLLSGYRD